MTKKVVVFGLLPAVVIALGVYVWLGGFQSVWIEEVQYRPRRVWGTFYQGKYGDLRLREIFVNTRQQLREGVVPGTLVVVNYDSLADTKEVNQLIGVIPKEPADSTSLNQTVDTLAAGKYVRVHLYGQAAVRPTPAQVNQKARDYASRQNLVLGKKVIEHYFGSDSMWVEYPIVTK